MGAPASVGTTPITILVNGEPHVIQWAGSAMPTDSEIDEIHNSLARQFNQSTGKPSPIQSILNRIPGLGALTAAIGARNNPPVPEAQNKALRDSILTPDAVHTVANSPDAPGEAEAWRVVQQLHDQGLLPKGAQQWPDQARGQTPSQFLAEMSGVIGKYSGLNYIEEHAVKPVDTFFQNVIPGGNTPVGRPIVSAAVGLVNPAAWVSGIGRFWLDPMGTGASAAQTLSYIGDAQATPEQKSAGWSFLASLPIQAIILHRAPELVRGFVAKVAAGDTAGAAAFAAADGVPRAESHMLAEHAASPPPDIPAPVHVPEGAPQPGSPSSLPEPVPLPTTLQTLRMPDGSPVDPAILDKEMLRQLIEKKQGQVDSREGHPGAEPYQQDLDLLRAELLKRPPEGLAAATGQDSPQIEAKSGQSLERKLIPRQIEEPGPKAPREESVFDKAGNSAYYVDPETGLRVEIPEGPRELTPYEMPDAGKFKNAYKLGIDINPGESFVSALMRARGERLLHAGGATDVVHAGADQPSHFEPSKFLANDAELAAAARRGPEVPPKSLAQIERETPPPQWTMDALRSWDADDPRLNVNSKKFDPKLDYAVQKAYGVAKPKKGEGWIYVDQDSPAQEAHVSDNNEFAEYLKPYARGKISSPGGFVRWIKRPVIKDGNQIGSQWVPLNSPRLRIGAVHSSAFPDFVRHALDDFVQNDYRDPEYRLMEPGQSAAQFTKRKNMFGWQDRVPEGARTVSEMALKDHAPRDSNATPGNEYPIPVLKAYWDHLHDISSADYKGASKSLGLSNEELEAAVKHWATLDPEGVTFDSEHESRGQAPKPTANNDRPSSPRETAQEAPRVGGGEAPPESPDLALHEGGGQAPDALREAKHAETERIREKLGLPERPKGGMSWDEARSEAEARGYNNPEVADQVARTVLEQKRPLSAPETIALGEHANKLIHIRDTAAKLIDEGLKAGNKEIVTEQRAVFDRADSSLRITLNAIDRGGSEWGSAGLARQALLKDAYGNLAVRLRAQASAGRPLNAGETAKVEGLLRQLDELGKKHEDLKASYSQAQAALKQALAKLKAAGRGGKNRVVSRSAFLDARSRLFGQVSAGIDLEALGTMVLYYAESGYRTVPEIVKVITLAYKNVKASHVYEAIRQVGERELQQGIDNYVAGLKPKGLGEKLLDYGRFNALSGYHIAGKLTTFSLQHAVAENLSNVTVGNVFRLAGKVSGRYGLSEGAPTLQSFVAGFKDLFSRQTLDDAKLSLLVGRHSLDLRFGDNIAAKAGFLSLPERIHKVLKTPLQRAEFGAVTEKYLYNAARRGEDVSEPEVLASAWAHAYAQSQEAILLNDTAFTKALASMRKEAPVTRASVPVAKVGFNYVGRTLEYGLGTAIAPLKLLVEGIKARGQLDKIPAEEWDSFLKTFRRGSFGASMIALGYYQPSWLKVGGYYSPGQKQQPGDTKFGEVYLFGKKLPAPLAHGPITEMWQWGATLRRAFAPQLTPTGKSVSKPEPPSYEAAKTIGYHEIQGVPFFGDLITKFPHIFESSKSAGNVAGQASSMYAIPASGFMQNAASDTDPSRVRKPQGFTDSLKMSVPGLREQVPVANNAAMRSDQAVAEEFDRLHVPMGDLRQRRGEPPEAYAKRQGEVDKDFIQAVHEHISSQAYQAKSDTEKAADLRRAEALRAHMSARYYRR